MKIIIFGLLLLGALAEEPLKPTHRPSFWSKKIHALKSNQTRRKSPARSTPVLPVQDNLIRDFANQLINETSSVLARSRSYTPETEDQSQQTQQQFWDEKDQSYHASSYPIEYDSPTAYHHPFPHPPPPPVHYYPVPQKKDDSLFAKFALVALLKLLLAKLKAIGFLKILLLFSLKLPIIFFKMLIAFKGFKFLKLISIPFLIAAFAIPFLPLIPFFFFSFLPFLFLVPLAFPLLLPLLLFLPIVPVTTPPTAAAPTANGIGRRRREIEAIISSTLQPPVMETNKTGRAFRMRMRPASQQRRYDHSATYNPFPGLGDEHTENLIELTQRVVQSQQCLERAACELAGLNDSQVYQSAIIWALEKIQNYAPASVQLRIKKYTMAYEMGLKRRSPDFCSEKFHCLRPKVYLIQGKHSYNVF